MRQHSRDWERKAKENEGAASELEQLKAANLAEQEKEKERADKAEAELNELKAQAERAELIASVADKANVPSLITGRNGTAPQRGRRIHDGSDRNLVLYSPASRARQASRPARSSSDSCG